MVKLLNGKDVNLLPGWRLYRSCEKLANEKIVTEVDSPETFNEIDIEITDDHTFQIDEASIQKNGNSMNHLKL